MTGSIPGPRDTAPDTAAQDAEHVQAAARLRRQRPSWVIVWSAPMRRFTASPLFRAPRGTHLTAATPGDLAALMDQAEQAARRRLVPGHGTWTPSPDSMARSHTGTVAPIPLPL